MTAQLYAYKALTADGESIKGVMQAQHEQEVRAALAAREMSVAQIKRKRTSGLLSKLRPEPRKVKSQEIIIACRQMATFVRVGIPVVTALTTIGEQTASARLRNACGAMVGDIERGMRLSEAFRAHPKVFPPLVADMVSAAEQTGNLDRVLVQAAKHIDREASARRKIRSAMIYPTIISVLAIVISIGIVGFVMPQFRTLYNELNVPLPATMRFVLVISDFMTGHAILLLIALLAVIMGLGWGLRTEKGHLLRDRTVLKLPLIAPMVRAAIAESFCRTLGDLLTAGVPISQTFRVVIDTTRNRVYRTALQTVLVGMGAGESLFRPLKATHLFAPAVVQMIKVGEETGSLDIHLTEAADMNAEDLDYRIKRMTSYLEPALIIFVGIMVGFVAVTMVSAIYSLAGGVK